MHNGFAVAALVTLVAVLFLSTAEYAGFSHGISGFAAAPDTIDVKVVELQLIHLNITLSDIFPDVGDTEAIRVDIRNLGSTSYNSQLEVTVLTFNGTLNPVANYFDSTVFYYPGIMRTFNTIFIVPTEDLFFVRARLPFGNKTYETFAAFSSLQPPPSNETGGTGGTGEGGGGGGAGGGGNVTLIKNVFQNPRMSVTNPESVVVEQGDTVIVPITVDNTGETPLTGIRLLLSVPTVIDFSVSPPQVSILSPPSDADGNNRTTFLITINVPLSTAVGEYDFDFEVISQQTNGNGNFVIHVVAPGFINETDLRNRLLSYELIAIDLDQQITSADRRGYDVDGANESLKLARLGIEKAKVFLSNGDLQNTRKEMLEVKDSLEKAALQLATATFFVARLPTINQIILIVSVLALVSGFVAFLYYRRRKRKERPKLIRKIPPPTEKGNE